MDATKTETVYIAGQWGTFGPMTRLQAEYLISQEHRETGSGSTVCSPGYVQSTFPANHPIQSPTMHPAYGHRCW
jgi:hypothetical protein